VRKPPSRPALRLDIFIEILLGISVNKPRIRFAFIGDSSPLVMLPLTRRTRTKKRRKEDALMERTWTVISRTYSLLKEPYHDQLKDPLRDPDKAFGDLDEIKYRAELELVDRYQSFVAELLRLSLAGIAVFGFLYEYLISSNSPSVDKGRSSVRKKHNS